MQTFAEEENIMSQPRRSLVGSYFGEKILLASPLIKWYLEHGLEVTHIYQVVEYTPVPCFQPFGEAVSDARRAGDVDPNKAIIADTMKLVSWSPIETKEGEIRFKVQKTHINVVFFHRWGTRVMERRSQIKNATEKSSFVKKLKRPA